VGASQSHDPAVAAPASSVRSTEEATIHADALLAIESFCEDTHLTHLNDRWDMLDATADGPYWKQEIDKVLGVEAEGAGA
jgi:hypothetical protein